MRKGGGGVDENTTIKQVHALYYYFKIWKIRKQQDNGMAFWAFYDFINHIAYNVNDVLEHAGTPFSVAWNSC